MFVLWDPADAALIQELEAVQNRAIGTVKSIKKRHSITECRTALELELKDRRTFHRFALMTKILSKDKKHAVLSSAYCERLEPDVNDNTCCCQRRVYISLC